VNAGTKVSTSAPERADAFKSSVDFTERDQIRRGTRGGLHVGKTLRLSGRSAPGRISKGALGCFSTLEARRTCRINFAPVRKRPANANQAVTRSSVSFAGTTFLSQWSKHSASGVSAANVRTTAAASWKMRFDTNPRINCDVLCCQPRGRLPSQNGSEEWNFYSLQLIPGCSVPSPVLKRVEEDRV